MEEEDYRNSLLSRARAIRVQGIPFPTPIAINWGDLSERPSWAGESSNENKKLLLLEDI